MLRNLFCKRSNSKHFRPCEPHTLTKFYFFLIFYNPLNFKKFVVVWLAVQKQPWVRIGLRVISLLLIHIVGHMDLNAN